LANFTNSAIKYLARDTAENSGIIISFHHLLGGVGRFDNVCHQLECQILLPTNRNPCSGVSHCVILRYL
jgi:hypothetical protein